MKHNEQKDFSDVLMSHQALESLSLPSEGISKDCYHHQVSHVQYFGASPFVRPERPCWMRKGGFL